MYLLQPNDGSGRRGHTLAVFKHVLAVISRMQTHIERTPGGLADATNTGGAKIRHPWPIRPGDYFQPIYLLNTHYPPPPTGWHHAFVRSRLAKVRGTRATAHQRHRQNPRCGRAASDAAHPQSGARRKAYHPATGVRYRPYAPVSGAFGPFANGNAAR